MMGTFIAVLFSVIGQLMMTLLFAREALTTQEGTFCRVKCTLASLLYLTIAGLLGWLLLRQGLLP